MVIFYMHFKGLESQDRPSAAEVTFRSPSYHSPSLRRVEVPG